MKTLRFLILLVATVSVFSACEKQSDPEPEYSFPIDVTSIDTREALRGNRWQSGMANILTHMPNTVRKVSK